MTPVLLCGIGRVGRVIGHYLDYAKISYTTYDPVSHAIFPHGQYQLVCSAAPYYVNPKLAQYTASINASYIDLGGDPTTDDQILNIPHNKPWIVSWGLAPGMINAFIYDNRLARENVSLYVGGISQSNEGFGWSPTWSSEGLCNEYMGTTFIKENGRVKEVPCLDGLEEFDEYEAFYTRGVNTRAHLESISSANISYRTIRYKGHRDKLKELLKDKSKFLSYIDSLPMSPDKVIIRVRGDISYDRTIYSDKWSAMAKATAAPVACLIELILDGYFKDPIINYSDIPPLRIDDFLTN